MDYNIKIIVLFSEPVKTDFAIIKIKRSRKKGGGSSNLIFTSLEPLV